MSKRISKQRRASLAAPLTTDNTCFYVKRRDGAEFGFTDADVDITFLGVTYKAVTGYTPSTVETKSDRSVDNMDVVAFLSDLSITEEDVRKGLWDFAEVEIFSIDRERPTDGIITLRYGWLGEIDVSGPTFKAEIRGIMQALKQTLSRVYQPLCRADLFDGQCKLSRAAWTDSGAVDSYSGDRLEVTDSSNGRPADYYTAGRLVWTGGANAGLAQEIRTHRSGGRFVLTLPPTFEVEPGDTFDVEAGCRKRLLEDCRDKFGNVKNFRGEPYLPGPDKVLDYPDAV